MRTVHHALPAFSAGTSRTLRSLHFGSAGSGMKAYIQASLHADEVPAMLVAQHLKNALEALEAAGLIEGEIVLVPMANPIGLAQDQQGSLLGRFDLATGINFNRQYKHLTAALIPLVEPLLGDDEAANTRLIRQAAMALLADWQPNTEADSLKKLLQTLAMDADIVLDLHCDTQAVLHVYAGTPLAEAAMTLAACLGAQALLVCKVSGDDPFDETVSRIWWELAAHFEGRFPGRFPGRSPGRFPIANACFSATVELRGETEVDHTLAAQDAQALIHWLTHAGHIGGPLAPVPPARCAATPLEGVEPVTAPHAGMLVFFKAPGDAVAAGEAIGEVIDPLTDQTSPVCASVAGVLFARISRRYVTRGMRVAKIAGPVAFRSGNLLSL